MDDAERFLAELTALTRKHLMVVEGCGCCGSPRIRRLDTKDPIDPDSVDGEYKASFTGPEGGEYLKWVNP